MKFPPIKATLKNGKIVEIREANPDDAEELRNVIKEYVEESDFIPYAKGEFNVTVEEEKQWIQSFINIANGLLLIVIIEGKIVGNLSLNIDNRAMLKHRAEIGIGMLREFRGLGIGNILFDKTIDWAKNHSTLEFLSLETHATNKSGIALYEKFGFKTVGTLSHSIKLSQGKYTDTLIMTLDTKNIINK